MQISIADQNSDADALAEFFSANLTSSYISHSELQGYRAIRPGEWAHDVRSRLRSEIQARLNLPQARLPASQSWQGVIEARDETGLLGLALVTQSRDANVPFGVIEDIVIDARQRGKGHGEEIMRWIIDGFRQAGISRVFLESGASNEPAHHLFERLGFRPVSIVMMRDD